MVNIKRCLKICIIIVLIIIVLGIYFFNDIPSGGEHIASYPSDDGVYIVNVYLHSEALSSDAIRCTIFNVKNKKERNIYWDYKKSNAVVVWVYDEIVEINNKRLNIFYDLYDWRDDN